LKTLSVLSVIAAGCMLAGCSVGNLLGGDPAPAVTPRVAVGNQLALPPDLALRAPSNTVDGYTPNGPVAAAEVSAPTRAARPASVYGTAPAAGTPDDIFAKYGISKTNPDGTPKTAQQLNRELSVALKAEKRRANPGYGTIRNIGSIFSDG
jgi:hypothetical protein